jgi:protein-L-isoaspartate O-methyltransferase
MIILGSLAIGVLAGYAVAVFSVLSSKAEVHSLQNNNRKLTEELNNLRNVAIDEGIYDTEDGEY